jgi:beta-galactosidase
MKLKYCLLGLLVALLVLAMPCWARETIQLSGDWSFRADPRDVGKTELWFTEAAKFDQTIKVPGAWNAQGVGESSKALFASFPGPGWYRKRVSVPQSWRGKEIYLNFGGVHRTADVWVNGEFQGTHIGYATPFKFEIAHLVVRDWKADIVVRVDGRRNPDVDPLYGCMDVMDMPDVAWGGIYRGVWLEAVEKSWIENVHVVSHIDSGVAEVVVETGSRIIYGGSAEPQPEFHLRADVYDQTGKAVGTAVSYQMLPAMAPADFVMVKVDDAKLWSPKRPYLYTVDVRLYKEGVELDKVSSRFGLRELTTDGNRFLLNGRPIFLRGFGDDCVFPNTIAPPADKSVYLARLKTAKEYGFNYIRCHSWVPPEEYLDAADEVGIMVQPEFPIAYEPYYNAKTPALQKFYLEQWQDVIKSRWSHPSVVTWCMSNEMWGGFEQAQSMYLSAKEIDPTRLVIDSNGVSPLKPGDKSRATLDFLACQFDEWGKMGFNDGKYDLGSWKPDKPVTIHEMGNFGTVPDLTQEKLFSGGVRPFWLADQRALAEKKGITSQLPKWVANSNRLQAVALKTNIEAARRSAGIRGYDQWLLQDYWTGSNGVLDTFYRQKGISAAEFKKFNAPTVLLMDCAKRSYWLGETAKVSLLVSRYEDAASAKATLSWKLRDSGKVVKSGTKSGLKIKSEGVQPLSEIALKMPASGVARKLTLTAQIDDVNGKVTNSWDFWVFPAHRAAVSNRVCVAGIERLQKMYPKARAVEPGGSLNCDLLIAPQLTRAVVDYLESGGKVLLLGPEKALPTVASNYKPYWWLGGPDKDSNAGTVVNTAHPALAGMPKQDWCDLDYYELLTGSHVAVLDDLPGRIEPIIRCIDLPSTMRTKAYLFEVRVGKGKLLVAAMNFNAALDAGDPAAGYLLDCLIRYAMGPKFAPANALDPQFLQGLK